MSLFTTGRYLMYTYDILFINIVFEITDHSGIFVVSYVHTDFSIDFHQRFLSITVRQMYSYRLPPNMDLEDGALMEPLSVGVHACKRGNVRVGAVCLILGAGPIGLVTLLSAKAMGASKIIITDVLDVKLQMAKQLGADYTINTRNLSEEDIINKIRELLGEDPTISFDCSGVEQCVRVAVTVTRTGGVVVLVGLGKFEMTLPLTSALIREVDIRGVFRYNNDYPTAIEMVKTGKINVKPLITHHYTLEDTLKAFHTAKTQEGNPIKVLIHANPNWTAK